MNVIDCQNAVSISIKDVTARWLRGLPTVNGINYGGWLWNRMSDLHEAFITNLENQGYRRDEDSLTPVYKSFGSIFFPDRVPSPPSFVWVSQKVSGKVVQTRMFFDDSPEKVDFKEAGLYVPASWGAHVLRFSLEGIVRIENGWSKEKLAFRWDKSIVPKQNLDEILR